MQKRNFARINTNNVATRHNGVATKQSPRTGASIPVVHFSLLLWENTEVSQF
jgi:hypothetical protein